MDRSDVDKFSMKIERTAKLRPPAWFSKYAAKAAGKEGIRWMERNEVDMATLSSAAMTSLAVYGTTSAIICAMLFILCSGIVLAVGIASMAMIPLLSSYSLLNAPHRLAQEEERLMLAESPAVIGMMSMSMHLSPSLERAVSYAASNGSGMLSERMRSMLWSSVTDWKGDIGTGIMELCLSFGEVNRNLRQSFQMVVTATSERTRVGLERLLDRANELAVQGVREKLDQYITSLSFPTMVIFAFGVLLPVMLFSIVPMLTIRVAMGDGEAMGSALGTEQMAFLILVVFPLCTLVYASSTLRKHPFRTRGKGMTTQLKKELAMLVVITAAASVASMLIPLYQPFLTLIVGVMVSSAYMQWKWRRVHVEARTGPKVEEEFINALFQIGNGMIAGSSLESALISSAVVNRSGGFPEFVARTMHQVRTGGMSISEAITCDASMQRCSDLVRNAYITIAESALVDPEASGRTAINLAKYIWELRESERKGRERMRSVVDMMTYTAMIFAPIVLAVTASLFSIVSMVSSTTGGSSMALIGGIYVVELTGVVCYFNHGLQNHEDARSLLYEIGKKVPVAMTTFVLTTFAAQEGLVSLF